MTLFGWGTSGYEQTYFQNNIASIFQRVRLLYGATPLEDIIGYNMVVRNLTEWTSTDQLSSMDQTSIAEGIGGVVIGRDGTAAGALAGEWGYNHVRKDYIQGIDSLAATDETTPANFTGGAGKGNVPNKQNPFSNTTPGGSQNYCTRRYQINFALGLFTQDKLVSIFILKIGS